MKLTRVILPVAAAAVFLAASVNIYASADEQKISMAVFRVQANNCAPSIGSAVEELAVADLYSTSLFIMSEKSQMDRIARRNGFAEFDLTDNAMAAKLGQLLNVQKIVVGSVSRIDGYKLTLRSIDSTSGTVDVLASASAGSDKDLEPAVAKAVRTIERHYLGYGGVTGICDITLSAAVLYPTGIIADGGAGTAIGSSLSASFNDIFHDGFFLAPAAAWYRSSTTETEVRSLSLLTGEAFAGWKFELTNTLSISPSLGAGVLCSFTNHSRDGITYNGYYHYSRDTFYNFITTAKADISFFIYGRWALTISPFLSYVPDAAGASVLPGLSLGARFLF